MGRYLKCLIWLLVISGFSPLAAQIIHPLYNDPFFFDYESLYRRGVFIQDFNYLPTIGPYFTDQAGFMLSHNTTPAAKIFHLKASHRYDDNLRFFTITTERYLTEKSKAGDGPIKYETLRPDTKRCN